MNGIIIDEEVLERLRERNPRFHETAYLFVLSALHYVIERLPEQRHISGRELAHGCRDLAIDRFGVMARLVLEHWGVRSAGDIGDIVFLMVDLGLLLTQPGDTRDDFIDAFDFEKAFESDYPWNCESVA